MPAAAPRPVSLVKILAILASFALFLLLVCWIYRYQRQPMPFNESPENVPANMAWEQTPQGRAAYLADLKGRQHKQATTYAWVDQKAGTVQLPIDRAMELVVQQYSAKK